MSNKSGKKVMAMPNTPSPGHPVKFDSDLCIKCNKCTDACVMDVFIPNPQKDGIPLILHPDECWYCGCCVMECPVEGAITLNYPVMWRVPWKNKATGKHAWVGMKNPPPPNMKPPV